ncbi:MAG: LacI family DNA-binding transcriptional regulator [Verrucomicrobia bacterium]|nr:LacI family DNA-binding transcriptional regulator [Verrucomicrobiota bacterium]
MKTPPAAPSSHERPPATVRQIAKLAGVSLMTVSRALRNQPRVAEKTRRKILKIAQGLGYRPDPEISKLMHHLRRGLRPRFQSVICGLTNWPDEVKPPYFRSLLAGVERQARARGYGFQVLPFAPGARSGARLRRLLFSQGVQGVMLLPQRPPIDLGTLLAWGEFSVAAASLSVLGPEVNRVAPHHFLNTVRLCRELAALGYRRIGLVVDEEQDMRANRGFSAALLSFGRHEAVEPVPPLVYDGGLAAALAPWFRRERPDALVATSESLVRECARLLRLKLPGPVGLASTSVAPVPSGVREVAGIDELPEEIGSVTLDLLATMVERRVRGLPVSPASTLLAGRWRPGASCPRRR